MSETSLSLKAYAAANPQRRPMLAADVRKDDGGDYEAFLFGRVGQRPELMIEFRKADGGGFALPYIDVREIDFLPPGPEKGFSVVIAGRKITIEGSNLQRCYFYFKQHRISELIEADRPTAMAAPSTEPIITSMKIQKA